MHFVEVYDDQVVNKMIKRGFKIASRNNGITVFINKQDSKFQFDSCDEGKFIYTNKLNI